MKQIYSSLFTYFFCVKCIQCLLIGCTIPPNNHNFVKFRSSDVTSQRFIFETMSFKNMQKEKSIFFKKFTLEQPLKSRNESEIFILPIQKLKMHRISPVLENERMILEDRDF